MIEIGTLKNDTGHEVVLLTEQIVEIEMDVADNRKEVVDVRMVMQMVEEIHMDA